MTIVHKPDEFTDKSVAENVKLREENEVLKAQIATLTGSQPTATVETASTGLASAAYSSPSPLNSTSTPHSPLTESPPTKALRSTNFQKI